MRGTIRERAPGVWEVRVRSGRNPLTGSYAQISRSVRGPKRGAEILLARLVTEIADGGHQSTDQTVGYLLDRLVEHLEALGRSPSTINGYRSLIRARLRPAFGSMELRRLQPADLDRFYRALIAEGRAAAKTMLASSWPLRSSSRRKRMKPRVVGEASSVRSGGPT
jgi:hypothetical protein